MAVWAAQGQNKEHFLITPGGHEVRTGLLPLLMAPNAAFSLFLLGEDGGGEAHDPYETSARV